MCYQGCGLNGSDGLGLRLKLPKGIKKRIKSLGRGVKKVLRSPITKGAIIGAAGGYVYQKVRQRRRAKLPPIATPPIPGVPTIRTPTSLPTPVPYIEPPSIPVGPSGLPLPVATGGPRRGPSMAVRQAIANKIMSAIPLTPEEMAIVQAGWLGEGMKAAAEAAYGSDAYVPGGGQPLPTVDIVAEKEKDNTILYAGLGIAAILLLGSKPQRTRRKR